jgi:hypothetical protein
MKKVYTILIVYSLAISYVHAQDWALFKLNRTSLFTAWDNAVKAIKMDSIAVSGSDTLYYHYPTLFYDEYEVSVCPEATYWINNPCIIKSTGELVIINQLQDTLIFDFNGLSIGDSTFVGESEYDFNTATMWLTYDSIGVKSILGMEDSVKYFSLHSRFMNQINMAMWEADPVNIESSKSFGLISLFNFYIVPWSNGYTFKYNLAGMDDPIAGLQNVNSVQSFREMYIGDEIHIEYYGDFNNFVDAYKVISKSWIGNLGYVDYACERRHFTPGSGPSYVKDTIYIHDEFEDNNWLLSLPDSLINQPEELTRTTFTYDFIPGVNAKGISQCFWEGDDISTWLEGFVFELFETSSVFGSSYYTVLYYKKGNFVWGTPYDDYFMSIDDFDLANNSSVLLYPIPADNIVNLVFEQYEKGTSVELYNIASVKSWQGFLTGKMTELDLSKVTSGVYTVVLTDSRGNLIGRQRLIKIGN